MKISVFLILLFSFAFLFVSCENDVQPTESVADQPNENATWQETESLEKPLTGWEEANEELGERFLAAFAAKDLDGVMDCFWNSPDLILCLEDGFVVRGWDNVRFGVQMLMDGHDALLLEVNEVSRFRLGANVYSVGTATWTRTANGVTTSFVERWTDVARKVNGNWVYITDHAHDLTPFTQVLP
jgi:ketosteroid isomerase-like protein